MMPDTSFPGLMVQIPYPSSSPEEVERIITRPIEDILATINNLETISSTSSASSANIHMDFKGGTNMDLTTMSFLPYRSAAIPQRGADTAMVAPNAAEDQPIQRRMPD